MPQPWPRSFFLDSKHIGPQREKQVLKEGKYYPDKITP
jgi:hypothetical protein